MIVGIDLGTTNSLIGYIDQGQPRLIQNAFGEVLTPSVVAVDEAYGSRIYEKQIGRT